MVGKHHTIVLGLALLWLLSGAVTGVLAEDLLPIRLVAMIDQDDHGDQIKFPNQVYYDYWASETYLLSSTGRIIVYDQKFFPVVSFGRGRGLSNPVGLAVDRHGIVYVCLDTDGQKRSARLVLLNQALFPIKTIVFDDIPELVDFVANRVAVAENGEIYLAGHGGSVTSVWVAVLSPEGKFLRFLNPPSNDAWRPAPPKKTPTAAEAAAAGEQKATPADGDAQQVDKQLPAGLKPKKAPKRDMDDEAKGTMGPAQISDVKIDRQGRIYLLSREVSFIYVFNSKEEFLFKFGEKGGSNGKLSNPVSLGVDLERRVIYVCDYMRHTILCYDYDTGKYLFEFGGRGVGALWFDFPISVDVDQRGRVVVADFFNQRMQVVDTSMGERRPLAGGLGTLAAGQRPTAEVSVAPVGDVSALAPPASPPEQSVSVVPAGALLPAGVVAPRPPLVMAGMAVSPVRLPSASVVAPLADRRPPPPPRELVPLRLKRAAPPAGPDLQPVVVAPLRATARMPRPAPVRLAREQEARRGLVGDAPPGLLARFRSLPAAVGVYGPVAALVGVGSWLLYTNR